MNFSAASTFCEPAGTASDQAHSQLAFLPLPVFGASAKPTLSATEDSFGLVTKEAATVASIHMRALAGIEEREVLVEAVRGGARRAGVVHQVDVEGRASPSTAGWSNCGFQFSSNQRAPKEFDMAVRKAMFSPQPALPRRQMP